MEMNVLMPTKLITGKNCVKNNSQLLKKLGNKCLIVTGKNSAKLCGALDDVIDALNQENIAYVIYDKIDQNPKLVNCEEAGVKAFQEGVDFIIGIGGGSPLDAAKCIAVIASNPTYKQKEVYSLKWENKPLPVVCVGTTSGTGSEVTKVSVITNYEGFKKSFNHELIYPVISFGDYRYTMHMSDYFTRSTALDALAHCVESYFNKTANEISQTYAVRGVQLLLPVLLKISKEGTVNLTEEDREILYNASIYGGLAINVTGTALPHTVGYLLTEEHQIPHGIACAVFLDTFLKINQREKSELVNQFFQSVGFNEEEYLSIIQTCLPEYDVVMENAEIKNAHSRWINNGSLNKTWGHISADEVDEILKSKFVK